MESIICVQVCSIFTTQTIKICVKDDYCLSGEENGSEKNLDHIFKVTYQAERECNL